MTRRDTPGSEALEALAFETRAIHVGQEPDPQTGAVTVPIDQTSTFAHDEVDTDRGWTYARTGNPHPDEVGGETAPEPGEVRNHAPPQVRRGGVAVEEHDRAPLPHLDVAHPVPEDGDEALRVAHKTSSASARSRGGGPLTIIVVTTVSRHASRSSRTFSGGPTRAKSSTSLVGTAAMASRLFPARYSS